MVKELKDDDISIENKISGVSTALSTIAAPFNTDALGGSKPSTIASAFLEEIGDLACGSIAGMFGKVIEHPFDTVKVRLQTQIQFAGPFNCLSATLKHEGIKGLFRGLPAPMLGSMMENATLFFTYRHCQNLIQLVSGKKCSWSIRYL
ncbi:mitochondrial ornithine carrier protein [Entomophthora muscae]|uniref:Mitochondrial ornithine carrier protein n=1 Tax=Entomophthora muscae TaxID=34485 RepID=A0ACC2SVN5_9FUNG|nr:mitochondrial ornithine carrier protein [Entomophthora muscae]